MSASLTFHFPVIEKRKHSIVTECCQVIGGSLFLALCSQIALPLPFSPVPLTFQVLGILLLGALFGSRKASFMVMGYYAQILLGMPVLAGGVANPFALIGPRAGYLLGFIIQAYLMGWFVERSKHFSPSKAFLGGLCACGVQLAMGASWLALFIGWNQAWMLGFFPFIIIDILKVLIVSAFLNRYYQHYS